MRIVDSLRRTFKQLQFLVTTHDPLCLRGVGPEEIVLLRREGRSRVTALTGLPDPRGLRADQLLTSEYFGLDSTTDVTHDREFSEYYGLMALKTKSKIQENREEELRTKFEGKGLFGRTRRERLMYEAIDRHLSKEAWSENQEERIKSHEAVLQSVARMRQNLNEDGEPRGANA
jgi:hypothetical protein